MWDLRARATSPRSAERDELELDVIRVPEDHRGVSEGLLLVPDAGVLDAELIESGHPGRQLIAGGHAEGQVVQPRAALIEGFAPVGLVEVQPDPDARARIEEHHAVAGVFLSVVPEGERYPIHPEQPLVPRHTRFDVG